MQEYYSSHADQGSLVRWLFSETEPHRPLCDTVFVSHGVEIARCSLRDAIEARSAEVKRTLSDAGLIEVRIPSKQDRWFDLDAGDWIVSSDDGTEARDGGEHVALEVRLAEAESRIERLERLVEALQATQGRLSAASRQKRHGRGQSG